MKAYELALTRWANHAREYAALITGLDDKWGYERTFVTPTKRDWSRSGKTGTTTVHLTTPGVYEISDPSTGKYGHEARSYARLTEDFELLEITKDEVNKFFGKEPITIVNK